MQIGDAKFDLNCIFTLPVHMSSRDATFSMRVIISTDACRRRTLLGATRSPTRHDTTPRGGQERMALRRLGWVWRSEQRGIQSCDINRKMATDGLTISSSRLAAACTQEWAMIYWMTMNVEKEHNQLDCTIVPLDTADERRAQEHCCIGRDAMASSS